MWGVDGGSFSTRQGGSSREQGEIPSGIQGLSAKAELHLVFTETWLQANKGATKDASDTK